ncbi:MAG: mechanosensitive ion channel [Clostridia bacterium]|nr:mechanosensitive ion channel [Clostridia bacterium]
MKHKPSEMPTQKQYRRKLRARKARLYAALILSFILVLALSTATFASNYSSRIKPQVNRAVIQVARLLPQLEQNEATLREAYDQMTESWKAVFDSSSPEYENYVAQQDAAYQQLVDDTLSWMNRVTKLRVGRDGFMLVVSKETSRIIAHPDEAYVGRSFLPFDELSEEEVIPIKSIKPWTKPEDLTSVFSVIEPYRFAIKRIKTGEDFLSFLRMTLFGCVIDYEDTYIVCGVPLMEMLSYVLENALVVSLFYLVLMGLFVKWIGLVMDCRRETARTLRAKMLSFAAAICIVVFGISWYAQILSDVTNDLKTMGKHANVAVETLNTYREQRQKINEWLDEFYITQCQVAALTVTNAGRDNLTRADMQKIADMLQVKYVYAFDPQGRIVVTNSPYDHFELGDDPEDRLYEFRGLLQGAFGVAQDPGKDRFDEYVQYVGISTRSEEDLCDGFVMIAVDPALRDDLLSPLTVDTVLANLIIGLPEYAIAIDKETLNIVATTGIGFKNASIESLGLKEENLTRDFSGFLKIDGTMYYAGVSESSDMFLVPIVTRSGKQASLIIALALALFTAATSLLILLMTLWGYQRDVVEGAPSEEAASPSMEDGAAPDAARGMFSRLIRVQEKRGLNERWHMNRVPKAEQTPEQRIKRILYRLLLLFCLFVLLPTFYASLDHSAKGMELNNLAYIISGNWQRGFNIFALTSCVFLLCAMYVAVVLINRVLYCIARVSDMRVETVCLLLKNAMKYICVVIFVYYGLAQFGVDSQTLLASAGILSLMISFGAKDLVSDIIAGFFTLFEGSYKVGDFVIVGSWYGTVTEIGLRTTKVNFFSETKIFNNSSMRDIINSDGPVARMLLNMPISYDADLVEVEAVLEEELPKLMGVIPGLVKPPCYEGVESFEDSSVMLRIAIYVDNRVKYPALRRLNREIKLIFDRHGIEIPFNQIVVHDARDGEGA